MIKGLLTFLAISVLASCSMVVIEKDHGMKRRNLSDYFVGSGVVRYFLPDLPSWANMSSTGRCERTFSARYMNFELLRNSFSFSYEQAVQFQLLFNVEGKKMKERVGASYIPFQEEENLFYKVSDQIQASIKPFKSPKFKRVHLVWIDPALASKNEEVRLKSLVESSSFSKGHPVFVSLCLSRSDIRAKLKTMGVIIPAARLVTYEMFSPYLSLNNQLSPTKSLDFEKIFKKNQSLHFYSRWGMPKEFIGNFIIHKY